MKFISVVVVTVILGIAGLAYAQEGQGQKKKSAKPARTMMKKADAATMSKEECAGMGKEECAKMKTHGSMECCKSDSTKSAPEK
jgi:hypothetical protein